MMLTIPYKKLAPGDRTVPWISQCRQDWRFKPVKYLCAVNQSALPETTDPDYPFLYIDISSVDSDGRWTVSEPILFADAPSRARRIVRDGDVLISTVRTYLRAIAYLPRVDQPIICSTGFAVLTGGPDVYPGFLAYWVRSSFFIDEIVARSVGVSYPAINASDIGNLPFPCIPIDEQRAIAAFLDRETARIDELIKKKERQIELLQEKRAAVISHAVTKGLNPNVKMKDSGIEWLGEIPEHWEIKAVWMLFHLGRGRVISNIEISENPGDYPVFSSQTENDGILGYIGSYDFAGDYLTWTTDGANAGTVFRRTGRFNCTNVCGTLKAKEKLNYTFFCHAINQATQFFVRHDINPKLMNNVMALIRVQVPPLPEQRAIAAFLDQETARIDALIEKIRKSIDLLREYRTALITAAVTGKIDVRGETA